MNRNRLRHFSDPKGYVRSVRIDRTRAHAPDRYPLSLPALRGVEQIALHPQVTFFIGENGSGKSTLIEAIAVAWGLNPEGGSRNFGFATRASHSSLSECTVLAKSPYRPQDAFFFRAESYFNVATEIERLDIDEEDLKCKSPKIIDSYGGRSLHEQSHGESFFALLMKRFHGNSLLILDEPEAALSPTRQMAMLARMHQLVGEGSQLIIATHSPILMAYPGALIFELSDRGVRSVQYLETEHYSVTKRFLNDTEAAIAEVLGPAAKNNSRD